MLFPQPLCVWGAEQRRRVLTSQEGNGDDDGGASQWNTVPDRSLRENVFLYPRVGDRPLRFSLYLLHADKTFSASRDLLSLEELAGHCDLFASLNVRKLRLTGGRAPNTKWYHDADPPSGTPCGASGA